MARDIMTSPVVSVDPDASVEDIAKLLLAKGISAVPVVDPEKGAVGMVSEADLMHRPELGAQTRRRWWLDLFAAREVALAKEFVKQHGLKARDVMHEGVESVAPEADAADIVAAMEAAGVRRVLVREGGELRGIVTRSNLLPAFLAGREAQRAAERDGSIRAAILEKLAGQPWATLARDGVRVSEGVVTLSGVVSSEEERRALRIAAESVPGVTRVIDRTEIAVSAVPYWD
nr:CBS domain-containing protein [Propylenella binzhouense]